MNKLSIGASYLKRGDTFDPEDHRMTHRLRVGLGLLSQVGIRPTMEHREGCRFNPKSPEYGHSFVGAGFDSLGCDYKCVTVWPEWVNDEMFEDAFRAADHIQSLRREASQAQINRIRAAQAASQVESEAVR